MVVLAVQQQVDDGPVHCNRLFACVVIDGLQVGYTLVIVVDVKEPVIVLQVIVDGLRFGVKRFFAFPAAQNRSHRVKQIQEGSHILLLFRLDRYAAAA